MVMTPDLVILRLALAAGVTLLTIGAVTAWASVNVAKRIGGLLIAQIAALLGLAVLGAPNAALMAGLAVAFVMLVLGCALLVRLQEAYGGVELPDLDQADEQSEPREPSA
jgi:hypothetical protein